MWFGAFPSAAALTLDGAFSAFLVLAALVVSLAAFAKGMGARYELKGRSVGLIVAVAGSLSYLTGTSVQSAAIHSISIAVFYSGCVLYLAGARALVSALPFSLIELSTFAPIEYGQWGLIYLDGLAWALVVTSVALLWDSRKAPKTAACHLCSSFESRGLSFCGSCGRMVAPVLGPSSRRLFGIAAAAVVIALLFVPAFPLVTTTPSISVVNFGLGGPQAGTQFAPLPGWGAKTTPLSVGGAKISEYTLTKGGISIQAFVAVSQNVSAFNKTRTAPVSPIGVPSSISQSMAGYSFQHGGTGYVDVQGTFQASVLNGSSIQDTQVAIDLRQTEVGFASDNGSSLYSAASGVISWTSTSSYWSGWAADVVSACQFLYQAAIASSFAAIGVALFTIARDGELANARRLEAMHALEEPEKAVLEAFGSGSTPVVGSQLRDANLKGSYWVPEPAIYSSLDELERRGLVSASVTLRNWVPVLQWRRLA